MWRGTEIELFFRASSFTFRDGGTTRGVLELTRTPLIRTLKNENEGNEEKI